MKTINALSPPGPRGNLLSGNLPEFRRDMLSFFECCARDYGDIVSVRLGLRRVLLINHPDYVEYVLATASRNFTNTYIRHLMRPFLGNGLLTSDGETWLRQRRLVQPAFHRQRIAAYAEIIVAYTERLLATWQENEILDVHAGMMQLTLEIVGKTLFDADVAEEANDVGASMEVVLKSFLTRWESLLTFPTSVPTPNNLRLRRAVRRLDKIIYRFIDERRQNKEDRGDLLSLLLDEQDETDGSRMTDKQLRDEAITLFLAGHETTANALSWSLYLISQHPFIKTRLVAELNEVLGTRRAPTFADLPQLKYVESIVMETLRLYPPAYAISRKAVRECFIGGYEIPANATLLLCQWVVHRDIRFFDDPLEFNPDRWKGDLPKRLPRYAYFPFGGGPRQCVGQSFAMMEATLVLATLIRNFHFTLVSDQRVTPWPSITLRPARGIKMVLNRSR